MAKNAHPKLKRAKKMITQKEISAGLSPFQSKGWHTHSLANHNKEKARLFGLSKRKKVLGIF
jgi:hypothetical protein